MSAGEDNRLDSVKLSKTINNLQQRLKRLEKQVAIISKKSLKASGATETGIIYQSPPKRRLGWGMIWLSLFLFIGPFVDFFDIVFLSQLLSSLPSSTRSLIAFALFVGGVVLILINPKQGQAVTKKKEKKIDLGQDSLIQTSKHYAKTSNLVSKKKSAKSDLESKIGKNWLPKIGIVSIVLGIAFFVVYAIQNKWIGPTGQVALGVLAGIGLIIAGEFFSKKNYHNYAMTLVGGGFAVIYFAMFSAYRFYQLLPLYADIGAITIIIIGAVFFSIRYNSTIIAGEAFFLGYTVPLLTSSVNTFFLIYAVALTAGLTALTYFKKWKLLGAGGIVAMYITHISWLDSYAGTNKNLLHIIFLFIYFVMFAIMALKVKNDAKKEIDNLFNSRNVIATIFLITYLLLFQLDFNNVFFIIIPLILLLLFLFFFVIRFNWDYFIVGSILMTYIVHWKWLEQNFKDTSLLINFIGLSIYFLLFNILIFFFNKGKNNTANVVGILLNSLFYYSLNLWPIFKLNKGYDGLFTAGLAVLYLTLSYLAYSKKMVYYFNTYLVLCFGYLALAIPLQFNREWITISWAVLTLILVLLSFRLKENVINIASSILGLLTFGRVLIYDSWKLKPIDFANIINSTRLFAFVATIVIFYIIAYLYNKNKNSFSNYKNYLLYVNAFYAVAATISTTIIIWIEIWDTNITLNAKKLWTSLSFVIQAIVILGFGFSAKIKLFRIMGLILFGLAIIKVFLYDLSNLETGYRIFSFIVLGVIALLGAFLYNKYKEYI